MSNNSIFHYFLRKKYVQDSTNLKIYLFHKVVCCWSQIVGVTSDEVWTSSQDECLGLGISFMLLSIVLLSTWVLLFMHWADWKYFTDQHNFGLPLLLIILTKCQDTISKKLFSLFCYLKLILLEILLKLPLDSKLIPDSL